MIFRVLVAQGQINGNHTTINGGHWADRQGNSLGNVSLAEVEAAVANAGYLSFSSPEGFEGSGMYECDSTELNLGNRLDIELALGLLELRYEGQTEMMDVIFYPSTSTSFPQNMPAKYNGNPWDTAPMV